MRLPKQKNIPYLGGLWTLIGYLAFIYSCVNTLLITIIAYSVNSSVSRIFHSYWIFMLFYLVLGCYLTFICYKYVIPSTLTFQQGQSVLDNRNPLYDKVCRTDDKIDRIDNKINEIEKIVKELKK